MLYAKSLESHINGPRGILGPLHIGGKKALSEVPGTLLSLNYLEVQNRYNTGEKEVYTRGRTGAKQIQTYMQRGVKQMQTRNKTGAKQVQNRDPLDPPPGSAHEKIVLRDP